MIYWEGARICRRKGEEVGNNPASAAKGRNRTDLVDIGPSWAENGKESDRRGERDRLRIPIHKQFQECSIPALWDEGKEIVWVRTLSRKGPPTAMVMCSIKS